MPEEKLRPTYTFTEDRLAELRGVVPEAFEDGSINWDTLRDLLAPHLADESLDAEHFGLTWPGKREARRLAAKPSGNTLRPALGEGVNEETTHNLYLEGDNLEVLKLLQKSYAGRVKMIYIDPPYNTGNDFVYKDNFTEPSEDYLRRTGQVGERGELLTTNYKTDGRFHSNWLNMIYPRLRLAKTLLREDGVIFVSIDDNEAHNLRGALNEVFGDENFLSQFYVQVRYADKTLVQDADFHKMIETVLIYRKSESAILNKETSGYSLDKFVWAVVENTEPSKVLSLGGKKVEVFEKGQYEFRKSKPSVTGLKEIWATGKILDGNSSGRFFRDHLTGRFEEDGYGVLYKVDGIGSDESTHRYFTGPNRVGATKGKYFQGVPSKVIETLQTVTTSQPIVDYYNFADAFGNCRHEGGVDFRGGKKPIVFLKKLLSLATSCEEEEIVLDFFSGSGSMAHAVLSMNEEDSGQRQFIAVQIQETALKSDFTTVTELGKERIRRVSSQMKKEPFLALEETVQDIGFKVLTLGPSNFRAWRDYTGDSVGELQQQFDLFEESPLAEGWTPDSLLTEVLLLEGFPLDSTITPQPQWTQNAVSCITSPACGHRLWTCFDETLHADTVNGLTLSTEDVFICRDSALDDNAKLRLSQTGTLKTI